MKEFNFSWLFFAVAVTYFVLSIRGAFIVAVGYWFPSWNTDNDTVEPH